MINILKAKIVMTKNLIAFYENDNPQTEYEKTWSKGYLFGLKAELKTLEELLTSAKMLQRLSA